MGNGGTPRMARAGRRPRAFRAPLAERSAVNRQVLGSIPSGGVLPGGSSVVEQWTVKCSMQRSIGREFKSPSPECFSIFGLVGYDARFTRERSRVRFSEDVTRFLLLALLCFQPKPDPVALPSWFGHIRVNTAHPIRTANLSTLELDQYCSGGPCGNLEC